MALATPTKLALLGATLGAVALLIFSDPGESVLEYLYVEQVAAQPSRYEDREIRMHGLVVAGSVRQKRGESTDYSFEVEHMGARIRVHYADLIPDTFAEGGIVILTGRLGRDGVFESTEIEAKCPSKYEEEGASAPT